MVNAVDLSGFDGFKGFPFGTRGKASQPRLCFFGGDGKPHAHLIGVMSTLPDAAGDDNNLRIVCYHVFAGKCCVGLFHVRSNIVCLQLIENAAPEHALVVCVAIFARAFASGFDVDAADFG